METPKKRVQVNFNTGQRVERDKKKFSRQDRKKSKQDLKNYRG